jgi:hypothetical protein
MATGKSVTSRTQLTSTSCWTTALSQAADDSQALMVAQHHRARGGKRDRTGIESRSRRGHFESPPLLARPC